MAEQQTTTPFAVDATRQDTAANKDDQQLPDTTRVEAVVDPGQPNGYKIIRSATGKNYVEVRAEDVSCNY